MNSTIPTFHLLYFKNLLDVAFIKFFELYQNKFAKVDDSYVLAQNVNLSKIQQVFKTTIRDELKKIVAPYDILNPHYYLIIGACMPKDNFLLKFKDNEYFPQKLQKFIDDKYSIKYVLRENDIKIDTVKFNQACLDVFNMFFVKNDVRKMLGQQFEKNVVFVQHKSLDCYSMFKVIKSIYGSSNCINEKIQRYADVKSPIVAVNDLIDKYIHNKTDANKSAEFKTLVQEIQQYLQLTTNYG